MLRACLVPPRTCECLAGLVEAAKARAHVNSDAELIEIALSRLALEDDFGVKLVRRKGSVPGAVDLEL
jgi:hypothetical protein